MKNFTDITNRLKSELGLTMDKEIAEFLGLSKSAFAERKRRNSFPEETLKLADLMHPNLKLDIGYLLTGTRKEEVIYKFIEKLGDDLDVCELSITPPDAKSFVLLNQDEMMLLVNFRQSDSKGKQFILDASKISRSNSINSMRVNELSDKLYDKGKS